MRNLKKILALVLALMMVLSVMVTASAADYSDADAISYTEAVEVMSAIGVLEGNNGAFNPQGTLDRASAAKIIAYVLTGGDLSSIEDGALNQPFEDAAGSWAAKFIAYIAHEGIVNGNGGGKFYPKNTLTGYEFAKMLLLAAGVEGEYTGTNWKLNVGTAAGKAGLTNGMGSDFLFKNDITREQAAQMALNAMKVGTTTVLVPAYYAVGSVKFTSAAEAYFFAQAQTPVAAVTYVAPVTTSDALLYSNFGVSYLEPADGGADAYGRPATVYTKGTWAAPMTFAVEPVLTYNTATTEGKIFSALGFNTASQRITLNYYINSATIVGSEVVTKGDTTPVGAQGTLVEVYQTAPYTYTVVQVDTYAVKLGDANLIAAVPATATTDGTPAMVWIDVDNDTVKDAGEFCLNTGFAKNQVVLYTAADGALTSVSAAEYVSGKITATAADYLRVDGEIKYMAAHADGSIGSGSYALNTTGYTYYVDTYGNLIMAVAGVPVTVAPNYVYVIATADKAKTNGTGDNLFDITETSAAAAQAKIIDLATGEIKIVNIATTLYNGQYYYLNANGLRTANVVGTYDISGLTGLRAYTELEDGSIVIGSTASTTSVTVKKDTAAVASGKFANSSTVLTVVEYSVVRGQITGATVTTTTGIANFPAAGKNYSAIVTADATTGVVSNMLVVKAVDAPVDAVDYAVFAKVGETTTISGTDFVELYYYVGGEEVVYYAPVASIGSAVTASAGVYDITLTNGVLTATTPVSSSNRNAMTVVAVDDTYMLVENSSGATFTIYFATTGYETYNADNYYAADVVEVDDLVYVYGATKGADNIWTGINLVVIDN